jgi:hypothetical protein
MSRLGNRCAATAGWQRILGQVTDPTLTLETLIERSEIVVLGLMAAGWTTLWSGGFGRSRDDPQVWLRGRMLGVTRSVLQRRQTIAATLQDFAAAGS